MGICEFIEVDFDDFFCVCVQLLIPFSFISLNLGFGGWVWVLSLALMAQLTANSSRCLSEVQPGKAVLGWLCDKGKIKK